LEAELARCELDGGRGEELAPPDRARRGGHDTDDVDGGMEGELAQARFAKGAGSEEDGARPVAAGHADRPGRHARASVASRTSSSSPFEAPTASSSSIESR